MSKNLIYCFSGTGNSYFVAEQIAKKLKNTDIVLFNTGFSISSSDGYDSVGFIFPCHGGGLPLGLFGHLKKLNINFNCYTYAICTYAGYSGNCFDKINSIIPLDYWNGISHHCSCNWLLHHNMMMPPLLNARLANKRAAIICSKITDDIISRKKITKNVPKKLVNKVESITYSYLAPTIINKFTITDKCTSCGLCSKICLNGNINIIDGKVKIGKNCFQCLRCLQYCPNNAITFGKDTKKQYHNPDVDLILLTKNVVHID